jgi:hypothetical protein
MLMETALVVTMTGLMMHMGDKVEAPNVRKSVAIVVGQDHAHTPRVSVRKCFRSDVPQDFSLVLKAGDRISFLDDVVTPGSAIASQAFLDHTPSLVEPITNAVVVGAVRARKPHKKVVAWLDYPKGELDIAWYHPRQARFVREGQVPVTQCVPKVTWLVAPTTGGVRMRIDRKDAPPIIILLKQSALVEITNQPATTASDDVSASAHFASYVGVLRRRYFIMPKRFPRVESGPNCEGLPTINHEPTAYDLSNLIGPRIPAIAAALQPGAECGEIELPPHNLDHPACTNTDWP